MTSDMKKILILFAGVLMTASCGIYNRYRPQQDVREDLYGIRTEEVDSTGLGALDWKTVFSDPCLQELIDSALVRNADLRTARLEIEAAEAMLLSAKLAYLPSFAVAPQGTLSSSGSGVVTGYTLPVTASWEIDLFGRQTNRKRSAEAALEQTREYEQAVRCRLIASVANLYYTLLMLDDQLRISTETARSWKDCVEATAALKEAGTVNEAALSQTQAAYYAVESSVYDLRQQIAQTENALNLLLSDVPGPIKRGTLAGQEFPEDLSVGVPIALLSNRPDVRVAEAALAQAFYATNAARADFYPSIVLSGNGGWTNTVGGAIVNPAAFVASALASLTQPIFSQGKLTAQLRAAKARQEEAAIAFEQALLAAGNEVNDALVQYQTARSKSDYLLRQREALQRAVASTELLMEYGPVTYLEVLTARQSLLSAELSLSANRLAEIQSVISLYQALGGGREPR